MTKNYTPDELLAALSEELDVSPSRYKEAQERYDAVGSWLNADGSALEQYSPIIYPQGSFALGTAIRPIVGDEYDVDAVCELDLNPSNISQKKLKALIGDRLKENANYVRMLDPKEGGRRCWTLKYAERTRFHLDILPSIPDLLMRVANETFAADSILITDRTTWDHDSNWPKSNPKGYASWFRERMKLVLEEGRLKIAKSRNASVQDVPDFEVQTPLQRTVQILKRIRDIRFENDEDKPISIIITTLAAHAYNNETDIVDALRAVSSKMRDGILDRDGVPWVPNPVNPEENFADKWVETPRKAQLFDRFLRLIEEMHRETDNLLKEDYLRKAYGEKTASNVLKKIASQRPSLPTPVPPPVSATPAHEQKPAWPCTHSHDVKLKGRATKDGGGFRPQVRTNGFNLNKGWNIVFEASTSHMGSHAYYWQVVNNGPEADAAEKLRGGIHLGNRTQRETTQYKGTHWIRCFVVVNGVCIAHSERFMVSVK